MPRARKETPEQRERRLDERRAQRKNETPEQRENRLTSERAREQRRRNRIAQNETPEQRENRLSSKRARAQQRRNRIAQNETPEERENRLSSERARAQMRRDRMAQNEAVEHIENRLRSERSHEQRRRNTIADYETPEQLESRSETSERSWDGLRGNSVAQNETPEQSENPLSSKMFREQRLRRFCRERERLYIPWMYRGKLQPLMGTLRSAASKNGYVRFAFKGHWSKYRNDYCIGLNLVFPDLNSCQKRIPSITPQEKADIEGNPCHKRGTKTLTPDAVVSGFLKWVRDLDPVSKSLMMPLILQGRKGEGGGAASV